MLQLFPIEEEIISEFIAPQLLIKFFLGFFQTINTEYCEEKKYFVCETTYPDEPDVCPAVFQI